MSFHFAKTAKLQGQQECCPGRQEWRPYRPSMDFHHFKHFYREHYFSGIA
jgi:hypothetical protein